MHHCYDVFTSTVHLHTFRNSCNLFFDGLQAIEETPNNNVPKHQETTPKILQHGDELTSRLHHVTTANGLNTHEAELRMLRLLPQNALMELPGLASRELVERAARANELRHFCVSESVCPRTLDRALQQLAFEGMLLKLVDEDGEILEPPDLDEAFGDYVNAWDFPYTDLAEFRKVKLKLDGSGRPEAGEKLLGEETMLSTFRNLNEWCFAEHLDRNTLLQVGGLGLKKSKYCTTTQYSTMLVCCPLDE